MRAGEIIKNTKPIEYQGQQIAKDTLGVVHRVEVDTCTVRFSGIRSMIDVPRAEIVKDNILSN